MKTDHIQQLTKNVDAIISMNHQLLTEKMACRQDLHLDNDLCLVDAVKEKILVIEKKAEDLEEEMKETENRLMREIETLSDTVEMQEGLLQMERERHAHEMEMRGEQGDDKIGVWHDVRANSIHRSSPSVTPVIREHKYVQTDGVSQRYYTTRECCIQVDMSLVTKKECVEEAAVSEDVSQPVAKSDTSASPSVSRCSRSSVSPCVSDVAQEAGDAVVSEEEERESEGCIDSLHRTTEQTVSSHYRRADTRNLSHKHTIDFLTHQVQGFSQKLEQAKQQVEKYQQELAFIKIAPKCKHKDVEPSHQEGALNGICQRPKLKEVQKRSESSPAGGGTDLRRWFSEGYLAGSKKGVTVGGERDADIMMMHAKLRRSQPGKAGDKARYLGSTAKCLRCQKLYRSKDNHQKACRFHPKGKHKLEKYDIHGKLARVTFLWECCMQGVDSAGCSLGEHV